MKKLILVRHAKSEAATSTVTDFDRDITEEGKAQAKTLAAQLKEARLTPQKIYCSTARRACETAMIIAEALGLSEKEVEANPQLYEASQISLTQFIETMPDHLKEVMIVGHNPTLSIFATHLNAETPINLSTCGVFVIDFDMSSWQQLTKTKGVEIKI